jgi:hypothetical protein
VRRELTVGFEKATIPIEKPQEFAELKSAVERAFLPENLQKFLKRLDSKGVRIRNFAGVLEKTCIEYVDPTFKKTGKTASGLYKVLPVPDQGQMREFYLSKIEEVDSATRSRFKQLYQYY